MERNFAPARALLWKIASERLSFGKRNGLPSHCQRSSYRNCKKAFWRYRYIVGTTANGNSLFCTDVGIRLQTLDWHQLLENDGRFMYRDSLTIENSFSGSCECVFIALIWKSLPADENHHDLPWVIISNFYLGSGEEELLDGSCGSPVLMEDGELSAFSVSRQTMARLFLNFFLKFNYSHYVSL